jgi:hypothetical protein
MFLLREFNRIVSEFEEDTYPHYFSMIRDHDKKILALGWQGNSHGNMLLFLDGVYILNFLRLF